MTHSTPSEIIRLSPELLAVHPVVESFPELSDDQAASLELSIKDQGIQEPLVVVAARGDSADEPVRYFVVDGRSRLRAALAQEITQVEVRLLPPTKDVLTFALESAINRRQLTRSGVALLLFEKHPAAYTTRNKGGRPKKLAGNQPVSGEELVSFRDLGSRYRVPREYFSYLAEMKAEMTAEEWAELRRVVLFEEASIPRQYAGFKTGMPAGSKRGAVVYAYVNDQGLLEGILPRAFSSLSSGFQRWTEIDSKTKAAVEKEWGELLDAAPAELVRIAQRKAAKQEARA